MKEIYYNRALQFSQELMRQNLRIQENETYLDTTLTLLDRILQFQHTMMASLSGTGEKALTPNLITHGVSYAFLQELLRMYWNDNHLLDLENDFYALSSQSGYKSGRLYRELLSPAGYGDLVLQFIRAEDSHKYLSYIIYLSKGHAFTQDELSCMRIVAPSIAYAHLEDIYLWDVRGRVNILADSMDHYPLGIMLLSGSNQVLHVNEIARHYLEDLGVTDPRLYSNFYMNRIYPYYMHNLRSRRITMPLQIGSYLFNVVSTASAEDNSCPAHQIFARELESPFDTNTLLESATHLSTCIYIIHNDLQGAPMSTSLLEEFHLTKRELQLAALVAEGKNNAEISDLLEISTNTVKTHLSNMYKKLGINYRMELMNILRRLEN